ncbi:MAG TPA: SMC-Scp complex subunit ScpB [Polyangiaceae bacterium]|nr:SMC-Scp complex subunit ScpB [Polyangiaceae bacterium]
MPNKNIKKRKRVVTTSDVVPAGSRDDVSAPEPSTGDATTTDATETSPLVAEMAAPGGAAPAETAPSEALIASKDEESSTVDPAATASVAAGTAPEASDGEVFSEKENAGDEGTEPAAKGDELWADESPAATAPAADVSRAHLKGLIEALVFVADQPLSLNDIAKAAGRADRKLVKALAEELRQDYARRGVHLDEVAGGLIFRTNPAYAPFIRDAAAKKPVRMTRAQLETLSIIAYRQPLTRPEVDDVRGVDSGPVMKMLLERGLIKILGKKDEPGRPLLYGTTPAFLEFFGLKALKDLPSLREFTELSDDSRRMYDREMGDSPDAPTDPDLATLAAAASAAGAVARPEDGADPDADPRAVVPGAHVPGDWFDPPTEPDTTASALEPELSETPDPTGKPAQGSSEGSA